MVRRRKRQLESIDDEPWPDESELFEAGMETIIAQGFTPGGFPYGSSLSEYRAASLQTDRRRGWARAMSAMKSAVESLDLPPPDVRRVRKLGQGLSRSAYAAEVYVDADDWPRVLVALVPRKNALRPELSKVEREARLLRFVAQQNIGFRVPNFAVAVTENDEAILVCECVSGLPTDLRAGKMGSSVVPWDLVGTVAAQIHRIPVLELGWLGGHATRRQHGEHCLRGLADLEQAPDSEVRDAVSWLAANLPPDEPTQLVHGDLLGQNLIYDPDHPLVVLDWEHALLGDPAHDLAIVTRGVRRPFQVSGGLTKLLNAYSAHSDVVIRESHVRFHEICLHLSWYADRIAEKRCAEPLPQALAKIRILLRAVSDDI